MIAVFYGTDDNGLVFWLVSRDTSWGRDLDGPAVSGMPNPEPKARKVALIRIEEPVAIDGHNLDDLDQLRTVRDGKRIPPAVSYRTLSKGLSPLA